MGDRLSFIYQALDCLRRLGKVEASAPYANPADGFASANEFVNIGAILTIDRDKPWCIADAEALLNTLQGIERQISQVPHRNGDGTYRDREIDIDIVAIEGFTASTPRLTVPHPRAAGRDFVLKPLLELDPAIATLLNQ